MNSVNKQRQQRKIRIRSVVRGTKEKPRLSVFRSNDHIYAQIIDDSNGKTIIGFSEVNLGKIKLNKTKKAKKLKALFLIRESINITGG